MKSKKLLAALILTLFCAFLVACGKVEPQIILQADFSTVEGEQTTLKPTVVGLKDGFELVYSSSDPSVVEVTNNGALKALKTGEATITVSVKDNDEVKAQIKVKVLPKLTLKSFAPTKIELSLPQQKLAVNASMKLNVTLTPSTASDALYWESSNEAVATVVNGTVFGHSYGKATITATSAIDSTVKGTIEVVVADQGTEEEVVNSVFDYLEVKLPAIVTKTFELPTHPNKDVTVTWTDSTDANITTYEFVATTDTIDYVTAKVKYGNTEKTKEFELKLALDEKDNLHVKVPLVVNYINAYFAALKDNKVQSDLEFPTSILGVPIKWGSNDTAVIGTDGKFTRPDNDVNVKITATVGKSDISKMLTFNVIGVGYTADEKIEYLKTEGVLKGFENAKIASELELPTEDSRFGATITWKSSDESVLKDDGKYANLELAEEKQVTLTATVKYDKEGFEFEKDVVFNITVKPLSASGKAAIDLKNAFELPVTQVIYNAEPFPGKLENLPTNVENHDGVTITWYGEPGVFNSNMEVLIPRISYTPVKVYAKFTSESDPGDVLPVVVSYTVNIGILTGKAEEAAFTARSASMPGPDYDNKSGLPPYEGGTGTKYALGFGDFYFMSHFAGFPMSVKEGEEEKSIPFEWDYYFFFTKGNSITYEEKHLKTENGKKYVDVEKAKWTPQWPSAARTFINSTNETIYVKLEDLTKLGAQAGAATYTVFAMDKDGFVTTGNTSIMSPPEGVTEIAIPAGGMLVNPAYLDGTYLRPFGFEGNKIFVYKLGGDWPNYTVDSNVGLIQK